MTIIVAQKCKATGDIWIGSDSRISSDGFIYPSYAQKWVPSHDGWWIGVCGSNRALNLVTEYPAKWGGGNAFDTANSIRDLLKEDGWNEDDDKGGAPMFKNSYILASNLFGVWAVSSNFCVTNFHYEFCAEGSGHQYAYGAAFCAQGHPQHIIPVAIGAAIKYDADCGGDIFVRRI